MTTKERLHQLIETLPEENLTAADQLLSGLQENGPELVGSFQETATDEEWDRFIESFGEDLKIDAPPLTDEQLRREHIYEDRDL